MYEQLTGNFGNYGIFVKILVSFAAGLLTSLTPCVYPMLPVTAGLFGGGQSGVAAQSRRRFLAALCFFCGLVSAYVAIGVASKHFNLLFGSYLGHPTVKIMVFCLLLALAAYTAGLFSFSKISALQTSANRLHTLTENSPLLDLAKFFIFGALSSLIAAPCTGPALILILALGTSTSGYLALIACLTAYAAGFALLLFVVAFYAPLASMLPRSGSWLKVIKLIFALLIIGFAFSFYNPFKATVSTPPAEVSKTVSGSLNWYDNYELALEAAKLAKKPVLIDFYADWCAGCQEYLDVTFKDPAVRQSLNENYVLLKLDLSQISARENLIMEKYQVVGLPVITLVDHNGVENKSARVEGYLEPISFLKHLKLL